MFSAEFLHVVRDYEISAISQHFRPGAAILEVGGGTGFQARWLLDHGFKVTSIDVATSNYRGGRVGPVMDYDGRTFPFAPNSFDIVFSSNTLEHVPDLARFHDETRRVLRPEGYCVHAMPSSSWRLWTSLANYAELLQRLCQAVPSLFPRRISWSEMWSAAKQLVSMARTIRDYAIPPRHGETGNAFTELLTFSRWRWVRHFQRHNFVVERTKAMNLFYTGHMVLGKRWPLRWRRYAASILGSACIIYVVHPSAS